MKEVLKMRKHSVRKWLHALLDLLPLVVIPVFMVYSHRHQIDSYSVQRTEYNTIHMQQNVLNGLPSGTNNIVAAEGHSFGYEEDYIWVESEDYNCSLTFKTNLIASTNDYIITSLTYTIDDVETDLSIFIDDISSSHEIIVYEDYELITDNHMHTITLRTQVVGNSTNVSFTDYYIGAVSSQGDFTLYLQYVEAFNLTQMFGSGNEPTIDEFNALFPNDYYGVDSNAVAYVPYTRTYNDSDIGSQIFYSLYNSVDKYFNCNKLFSFNGVYNWINFNLFGGNAPLMVDVVYQIIVYEFFMDLIFLIYSVFMFIIDFASNFLEYSFSWSRRGGR